MRMHTGQVGVVAAAVLLSACGAGTKLVMQREKYDGIKKIAVVEYTVPHSIEYKENPRKPQGSSLLRTIVKALSTADPVKAATVANEAFCEEINGQGLSFTVLAPAEVKANPAFAALVVPPPAEAEPEAAPSSAIRGAFNSFVKNVKASMTAPRGVAAEGMNTYGLAANWPKGSALTGAEAEKKYLMDAARALNVDAVLVVNDQGFSFSCTACAGAVGNMNGAASTGSAFSAALVDRNGEVVLEASEWFNITGTSAVMAMSSVNPLEHEKLFKAHGRKTADLLAAIIKKATTKS